MLHVLYKLAIIIIVVNIIIIIFNLLGDRCCSKHRG